MFSSVRRLLFRPPSSPTEAPAGTIVESEVLKATCKPADSSSQKPAEAAGRPCDQQISEPPHSADSNSSPCSLLPSAAKAETCACSSSNTHEQATPENRSRTSGKILYGSQKGTCAAYAHLVAEQLGKFSMDMAVVNMEAYEVEHLWKERLVVIIISTYEGGTPPASPGERQ